LTQKDRGVIEEEIFTRMKSPDLEIHTRQGNPSSPIDLEMVAAKDADTVIVLVSISEHFSEQQYYVCRRAI
jgi:hypothetical protein